MFRLFRSIRQQLLLRRPEGYEGHVLEGRVSRYFGYAFGEIVLIVVGILLALQVSEWNQSRKDRTEERLIISNLHGEFLHNKKIFSEVSKQLIAGKESNIQLMELMNKNSNDLADYDLFYLLYQSIDHFHFTPSNNVASEILQSGKLGLLKDEALKNSLRDWERVLENNLTSFNIHANYKDDQLIPYLMDHIALKNVDAHSFLNWEKPSEFEPGVYEIFKDRKFENLTDNLLYCIILRENDFDEIEQTIDAILELTTPETSSSPSSTPS